MRTGILAALGSWLLALPISAGDGVIEINQARAIAGGITPGDAPSFPVTIDQPGSYVLTSDLVWENTTIRVLADDVTIDLNGFTLRCSNQFPFNCNPVSYGVLAVGQQNTVVVNGTVTGFEEAAISLGTRSRVERVRAVENDGAGISCLTECAVLHNASHGNSQAGFEIAANSLVIGNISSSNQFGMLIDGSVVRDNDVSGNTAVGIQAGLGSVVVHNRMEGNGGCGLRETGGSAMAYGNNVLTQNNGADTNLQVSGGTQIATNFCGTNTSCGTGTPTVNCP